MWSLIVAVPAAIMIYFDLRLRLFSVDSISLKDRMMLSIPAGLMAMAVTLPWATASGFIRMLKGRRASAVR